MRKAGFAWGMIALVGALGAVGCADGAGTTETAPSEPGVASAPLTEAPAPVEQQDKREAKPNEGHHGMRHERGPLGLLGVAMHELDLSDAQKATIKSAMEGLREGKDERREASPVAAALAAGLRAGKIDEAAVLAKVGSGKDEADQARLAKALDTLHDTLTAEQRSKLVATMTERMDAEPKARGGKAADGAGKRGFDKSKMGKGGPVGHLLRGIELKGDQQKKIDEALAALKPSDADRDAMKERGEEKRAEMRARMATFATDGFDAKAFLADKGEGHEVHAKRLVKAVAAIAPILDASQREELAKRLESGPVAGKHGARGARGVPGARAGKGARARGAAPESL